MNDLIAAVTIGRETLRQIQTKTRTEQDLLSGQRRACGRRPVRRR